MSNNAIFSAVNGRNKYTRIKGFSEVGVCRVALLHTPTSEKPFFSHLFSTHDAFLWYTFGIKYSGGTCLDYTSQFVLILSRDRVRYSN